VVQESLQHAFTKAISLVQESRQLISQSSAAQLPEHNRNKNATIGKCQTISDSVGVHDYLLLCIPFMRWATKLCQVEICQIKSDYDYFRLLRWYYGSKRGSFLSFLQLKKVNALHFAKACTCPPDPALRDQVCSDTQQFELYRDDFVDVRIVPSIPPTWVGGVEYSYNLSSSDVIPPIGPNLLLHFFEHPDHASVRPSLFSKIPKKKRSKLVPCPVNGSSAGWGILIVEGFNWNTFFLYSILGFLLCATFGTTWAILKNDVQGGFGISAYLLAFGIFIGGFVHTRSLSMRLPQT
jgi:hypothetical protein